MNLSKNKIPYKRIAVDIVVFLAAFMAPWWLVAIMAIAAAFYFPRYLEIVIVGIIIDSLYNGPAEWFAGFPYAITVAAILFYIGIGYAKTFLR